jgi:hypothetical protein
MATTGRKPIPKTQKEIANDLIFPSDPRYGNPNDAIPPKTNRGYDTSFKDDPTKLYTVGIQDIDEAVLYYFENIIQPYVIQNGQRISVPIIYGSPERWKSVQKDGYYKDKNGAIMLPLLMFKRNNITKDRSIGNKLDANQPYNYGIFEKKFTPSNAYSQFNVLTNAIPIKTYYAVAIPDYVTVTYSCVVQTYYVEQMNKIVEAINYASDSYWGDPERFKFRARIDSFNTIQEIPTNGERVVKSTFDIVLRGYIVPEVLQKDITQTLAKFREKSKLVVSLEATSNPAVYAPTTPTSVERQTRSNQSTDQSVISGLMSAIAELRAEINALKGSL